MSSKTIWIRYWKLISFRFRCRSEFGIEICITLISIPIWNRFLKSILYRFQYRIQIGTEIGINSVYTDFRFGIGAKSVRYRYTEPINRYTDSRYTVSSLVEKAVDEGVVCDLHALYRRPGKSVHWSHVQRLWTAGRVLLRMRRHAHHG